VILSGAEGAPRATGVASRLSGHEARELRAVHRPVGDVVDHVVAEDLEAVAEDPRELSRGDPVVLPAARIAREVLEVYQPL
jgi:hypothetical protein